MYLPEEEERGVTVTGCPPGFRGSNPLLAEAAPGGGLGRTAPMFFGEEERKTIMEHKQS